MSEKRKLTLSINSDVIKKAKELNLNLSEITETALKISTLDNDKLVSPDELRAVYVEIIKKIATILKKWDMELTIGLDYAEGYPIGHYTLTPYHVILYSQPGPYQEKFWVFGDKELPINRFYEPDKIIANLINKIYEKAIENKEIIDKLQILKNILELSGLESEQHSVKPVMKMGKKTR
ncbi:MAG: type II toxin-antitoxin system CcdA family antitoxin [Methanosarcinales archaeon]|nr:type II toxin-antitoxin system CcdA family antitoxin [Methanosarcinales archaeon]